MTNSLFKKDKLGRVRVATLLLIDEINNITILSKTGLLNGKQKEESTLAIKGKAGRTDIEQAILQFKAAEVKLQRKGYKTLQNLGHITVPHDEGDRLHTTKEDKAPRFGLLEDFLEHNLPEETTDINGIPKIMKCTAMQDTKTNGLLKNVLKKVIYPCMVQPKLDGVNCTILFDKEKDSWTAKSSGGLSYDVSARFIIASLNASTLPKETILSGELYIHGESLGYISGLARKETPIAEQRKLIFRWYDKIVSNVPNVTRQQELDDEFLAHIYNPAITDYSIESLEYKIANNFEEFEKIYQDYVDFGFEGAIVRNLSGVYEQGVRSKDVFKRKDFQDAEFIIIGMKLGKRGSEDMVFILETKKGARFEAKPLGNRRRKEKYVEFINNLVGRKATVQYLTLSDKGIPQGNPRLKVIRDYE